MKKLFTKKTSWRSLLSVFTIIVFILLAVGSFFPELSEMNRQIGISIKEDFLDNGDWQETETHSNGIKRIYEGEKDSLERWHGRVVMRSFENGVLIYTETMYMSHGALQGLLTRTFEDGRPEEEEHYLNGINFSNLKAAHSYTSSISAFGLFESKYPYYLRMLETFSFDSLYVVNFLNTFELLLNENAFTIDEFDSYYQDVIDSLGKTQYDTIIFTNQALSHIQGLKDLKNDEFRMAVIDRYRIESDNTYDIVEEAYPKYLLSMNDAGISNSDFEDFCNDLDDTLDTYSPLDKEDPFFVDSVDSYLSRALSSILNAEESSGIAKKIINKELSKLFPKSGNKKGNKILSDRQFVVSSTPKEVAEVVMLFTIMEYYQADLMKKVVKESWSKNIGIVDIPSLATVFVGNNSSTSVALQGYILDDGGDVITSRGIAWAAFHNPTIDDFTLTSGTGTSNFAVSLDGLTEGTKYYARTYAANSAGTAYGNCVYFVAGAALDINDNKAFANNIVIYPNPASTFATFKFHIKSAESINLSIIDMNGRGVLEKEFYNLTQGENQIKLNLSNLKSGLYTCQLNNNKTSTTCKLIVKH